MKPFRLVWVVLILLLAFHEPLCAQQTPAKLAFEVATIRLSPPLSSIATQAASGKINLGMRMDAAQLDLKFMSLTNLIAMAYKLKPNQIAGPDWMQSTLWEIHAKLPAGSNKEQASEMMQSLLAERFKLTFHRENRELPVYALTVAKSGVKIKEAVEEPAATDPDAAKAPEGEMTLNMKQESSGVSMDMGKVGKMHIVTTGNNPVMQWEMAKVTMADFTDILSQFSDRQVIDMTELKGKYKVILELPVQELMNLAKKAMPEYAAVLGGAAPVGVASDPSGGSIFQAVKQLGLSLDTRKVPMDTIVVDSVEKEPTEN
jgi:uncharacterized protein (TIGR03435 family)